MKRIASLAVLAVLMAGSCPGQSPAAPVDKPPLRVLSIGNSFSASLCRYLPAMAAASSVLRGLTSSVGRSLMTVIFGARRGFGSGSSPREEMRSAADAMPAFPATATAAAPRAE